MSGRNTPTSHYYYMLIDGKSQIILTGSNKIESALSKRTINGNENGKTDFVGTARNSDCGGHRIFYLYGD